MLMSQLSVNPMATAATAPATQLINPMAFAGQAAYVPGVTAAAYPFGYALNPAAAALYPQLVQAASPEAIPVSALNTLFAIFFKHFGRFVLTIFH